MSNSTSFCLRTVRNEPWREVVLMKVMYGFEPETEVTLCLGLESFSSPHGVDALLD